MYEVRTSSFVLEVRDSMHRVDVQTVFNSTLVRRIKRKGNVQFRCSIWLWFRHKSSRWASFAPLETCQRQRSREKNFVTLGRLVQFRGSITYHIFVTRLQGRRCVPYDVWPSLFIEGALPVTVKAYFSWVKSSFWCVWEACVILSDANYVPRRTRNRI